MNGTLDPENSRRLVLSNTEREKRGTCVHEHGASHVRAQRGRFSEFSPFDAQHMALAGQTKRADDGGICFGFRVRCLNF